MTAKPIVLKTERLLLRPWKESDLEPFAAMNADIRVMEYFPSVLTRLESDQLVGRAMQKIERNGWGLWAAALLETDEFIGFIGLNIITASDLQVPFSPAVEIGWRIAYQYWGKGYAPEGALAALECGFKTEELKEIVAFTAFHNQRSRSVMKKIGMSHNPSDDFDHPKVPEGHHLRRHVLYRIKRDEWSLINSETSKK